MILFQRNKDGPNPRPTSIRFQFRLDPSQKRKEVSLTIIILLSPFQVVNKKITNNSLPYSHKALECRNLHWSVLAEFYQFPVTRKDRRGTFIGQLLRFNKKYWIRFVGVSRTFIRGASALKIQRQSWKSEYTVGEIRYEVRPS